MPVSLNGGGFFVGRIYTVSATNWPNRKDSSPSPCKMESPKYRLQGELGFLRLAILVALSFIASLSVIGIMKKLLVACATNIV